MLQLNVAFPLSSPVLKRRRRCAWVCNLPIVSGALMAGGALGDTLGRRRPLRWGIMAFALSSVGCCQFQPNVNFLSRPSGYSFCTDVPKVGSYQCRVSPSERGCGQVVSIMAQRSPRAFVVGWLLIFYPGTMLSERAHMFLLFRAIGCPATSAV